MFTNEQLQALIRREVIGELYPYSTKDQDELKNYLKPMLAELKRKKIHCLVESDHFGSGYASYIQWFCYEEEHVEVMEGDKERTENIKGLHVLINRLAPVILIGNGEESHTYSLTGESVSSAKSMLDIPDQLEIEAHFQPMLNKLERLFMKYNFTVLRKADVEQPLPFDADIPTISREKGRYLVWDAIFYWED